LNFWMHLNESVKLEKLSLKQHLETLIWRYLALKEPICFPAWACLPRINK
jgi:hypothetical protein